MSEPPGTMSYDLRSIRVDGLPPKMDEIYLFSCFHDNAEVLSATVLRNRRSGVPLDYGFVEFASHSDAEFVLESYNGERMPNFNQERFCLSWDTDGSGTRWRWDYTYESCSFFGYDKVGNEMDTKTMIENYVDSIPSVLLLQSELTRNVLCCGRGESQAATCESVLVNVN